MTVRLRTRIKRVKRSVRSAIVRSVIRLCSLLPLGAALAVGDAYTGRAIIRTFRQGRALGLLVDQDTDVQGVFVPFSGRLAYTPRPAAACSGALEVAIRRSPEEWVWMHERWKTRPPFEVAAPQQASTMPKTAELSDA